MLTRTALASLALSAGSLALAGPATAVAPDASSCLVAAHRGNTNVAQTVATENTMNAFTRAGAAGADYLETDMGATSDDTIMLMHDNTVDRTTNGTGTLRSKTGTQVKALTTLDGVKGGVPYFSELVAYAQAHPAVKLLPQISAPGGPTWWTRLVANLSPVRDRVVVQGANPADLDHLHSLMPDVPLALVTFPAAGQPTGTQLAPYGGWVGDYSLFSQAAMDSLDPAVRTYPYVVNSTADFSRFAGQVSAVITNKPAAYVAFRATAPACQ
jgi:glycerophosphoryl diester phosphodiesterase